MKAAPLSLALFGGQLMTPASDHFPALNVDALCRGRSADDKLMRLPESQSVADCIQDETNAKQTLSSDAWANADRSVRNRCASEIVELGTRSYLDLLTCIQMAGEPKLQASGPRAGGKKRKAN